MNRINDIEIINDNIETLTVYIDGEPVVAASGETVLSTLFAHGKRSISRSDHNYIYGAYCGMGICYCCVLDINGVSKKRACQTVVSDGMRVITKNNRSLTEGMNREQLINE